MRIPQIAGAMFFVSSLTLGASTTARATTAYPEDKFEYVNTVPPLGTSSNTILAQAPNPAITVKGEKRFATFVVDLSKNVLYHYNELGIPQAAYLIASGKKSTPTSTGVRIVSHVETYPYKYAPTSTKRRKTPGSFGPKAIILQKLDPKTGSRAQTGEFIHGTNVPSSIGKYASHGCMRMNNEIIKKLAKLVKSGNIVIIMRSNKND